MPRPTTATLKAIELRWVVGEDALARTVVGRPVEQQVEQIGVVGWRWLACGRVRPVARPHHALRRMLHQRLCQPADILVLRRTGLGRLIRRRELHPASPGVDETKQALERLCAYFYWLEKLPRMVDHELAGKALDLRFVFRQLPSIELDVGVPAE